MSHLVTDWCHVVRTIKLSRSLVDDSQFHEACQRICDEPVPYFQQLVVTPIIPVGPDDMTSSTPSTAKSSRSNDQQEEASAVSSHEQVQQQVTDWLALVGVIQTTRHKKWENFSASFYFEHFDAPMLHKLLSYFSIELFWSF